MASNIKFKRSAVQNRVPTTAQLELGELALNTYDGKLYTEINTGSASVVEIGSKLSSLVVDGDNGAGNGDVVFHGATAGRDVTWDHSDNSLKFADNTKAKFGASDDLEIFCDGTHSKIVNTNTSGYISILTDNFRVQDDDGSQNIIRGFKGAAVELYHNNAIRLTTTVDGADVSGTGSLKIPVGTTAQRSASPTNGDLRYNSTTGGFEGYSSGGWGELGGGGVGIGSTSINPGSGVVGGRIGVGFTDINFVGAGLSVTGYGSTVVVDISDAVSRRYGRNVYTYTATEGQTTFTGLSYTNATIQISVYLNGARLSASAYTATSGNTVVLATGASVGDNVEILELFSGVNLSRTLHSFTATAGQTTFTGLSYLKKKDLDVYLNGIRLSQTDYTATDGASIVLSLGASVNDLIEVIDMGAGATWSVGGTEPEDVYRLDGGVGIGTSNPTDKLNVIGNARVVGILTVGTGSVTIDNTTVKTGTSNLHNVGIEVAGINVLGADTPIGVGATIYNTGGALFAGTSGIVTATAFHGDGSQLTGIVSDKIFEGNTEVETVDTGSNGHIKFTTEGSERLRIDANGDINLGNNPTNQYGYKLNIQDSQILYAQTASSSGTELKLYLDHGNTIANFGTVSTSHLAFVTANTERLRITNAGKLDITNPSSGNVINLGSSTAYANAAINIYRLGNGYADMRLSSNYGAKVALAGASNNTDEFFVQQDNTKNAYIYNEATAGITFGTSNTGRMWLDSSGNFKVVGISTFNSSVHVSGDLDVAADIRHIGDTDTRLRFETDTISARTAGSERLRITSDGQIGVNNTSPDAWHSTYKSLQIYDAAVLYGSQDDSFVGLGANHFLNTSGDFKYSNSDFASRFYQVNGGFHFESVASGTAGNTFSFTERLRITSGGSVNIGGDYTQTSKKFKVTGNATIDGGLLVTGLLEGGSGFSVVSGNLTLPAYTYHDGDSDTYYGFSGANQFSVFTGGTARVTVTDATTTVANNLTVTGNLQVDGTQTTVNSTTMTVDDKNIVLGSGAANDAAADGGGITLESGDGNKTWNWVDSTDAWTSSEHIHLGDDKRLLVGAGSDFSIRHTGTDTIITNATGDLYINNTGASSDDIIIKAKDDINIQVQDGETAINCIGDGAVELYHNNLKKFETTSSGVTVTGDIALTSSNAVTAGSIVLTNSSTAFTAVDGAVGYFGTGNDLRIFHDGSDSYIKDQGTGQLVIDGNAVILQYSAATKLATTSSGADITGNADISGYVNVGGNNSHFSENNLRFKPTGHAYIDHNTTSQSIYFRVSNSSSNDTNALILASSGNATFAANVAAGTFNGFATSQSGGNNKIPVTDSSGYLLIDDWIRVGNSQGIYAAGGSHLFNGGASTWKAWINQSTSASASGIGMRTSQGTDRGWAYADTAHVGFLNAGGNWLLRAPVGNQNAPETGGGYTLWHSNNDGAGSGLDADTLDGVQGASYLRSDANDSMSGVLNLTSSTDQKLILSGSSNPYIRFQEGTTNKGYLQWNNDGNLYLWNDEHNNGLRVGANLAWYDSAYYTIWHSNNDGSGSGLDADTLDGLQLGTGRNDSANQVVRTNGSGYIDTGHINISCDDTGTGNDITRFYASQDAYIRYIDKASMRSVMNTTAVSGAYGGRETYTSDTNYWVGSCGHGTYNLDTTLWDYGSCFWDAWSNPSGQPSGTSHWNGVQAMHYTNGSGRYGMRITLGAGQPALAYIQGRWNATTYGWNKLWNEANDGSGSGLDADTVDGYEGSRLVINNTANTVSGAPWELNNSGTSGWAFRFYNSTGSNNYTYLNHGTHGPHIRNDSATNSGYLLQVYQNGASTFMVRGGDGLVTSGGNTMWHVGNDGSGSGLDADTCDGQHLGTTSSPTFAGVNCSTVTANSTVSTSGWFYNQDSGEGLYNNSTTQHWYSDHDDVWNMGGGSAANGIRFRDEHGGSIRGYVYANNSNLVGFLSHNGNWRFYVQGDSYIGCVATVIPHTDGGYDLGLTGQRWNRLYLNSLYVGSATGSLVNEGGISATTGGNTACFRATGAAGHNPLMLWNNHTSGNRSQIQFADGSSYSARGSITTNGSNTSYNTSSDYRLKQDDVLITDGITKVKSLKPKRFKWKDNLSIGICDGFFAHEVQEVVPTSGATIGTKDEVDSDGKPVYQQVDQSKLIPVLTAALQEAIAKIETLETKVAALESS